MKRTPQTIWARPTMTAEAERQERERRTYTYTMTPAPLMGVVQERALGLVGPGAPRSYPVCAGARYWTNGPYVVQRGYGGVR